MSEDDYERKKGVFGFDESVKKGRAKIIVDREFAKVYGDQDKSRL